MIPTSVLDFPAIFKAFDGRELSMFHLGILLRDKVPMSQALRQVSVAAGSRRIKTAAARAADLLAAGHSPAEIFAGSELSAIPANCRFILASPLTEELKGQLLSGWQRHQPSAFYLVQHLYYPAQTLAVGGLTMISLFMFVLPQFKEILMGTGTRVHGLAGWVLDFSYSSDGFAAAVFLPVVIMLLLAGVFYAGKLIFGSYNHFDELNLLRMLNAVSAEHRFKVLEVMAVSHNFPQLAVRLKSFARAVNSGEDIVSAGRQAGLDGLTSWFLQLSASEGENSIILEQGTALLESRLNCGLERAGRLLEIFSVLFQGGAFGIIVYTVFQAMVAIMMGAIA